MFLSLKPGRVSVHRSICPYEQTISARQADQRSDLFALVPLDTTCWLDDCLSKVRPPGNHGGKSRQAPTLLFRTCSKLNPKIDALLAKLLTRKPEDRFQSASDLIIALDASNLVPAKLNGRKQPFEERGTVHIADQPTNHDDDVSDQGKNAPGISGQEDIW